MSAPLEVDVPAEPLPDAAVMTEVFRALDEEIDRLPDRCRRAVVLCYLEGLTAADAAQRLGCPTGTVESRLAAGRKRLCARLTRRGIALPTGLLTPVGLVTLTPDAVARVARAGVMFGRGGVNSAVRSESVRIAKEILAMWRTKTWATLLAVALAALTATAGLGWTDEPLPPEPPVVAPAEARQPQPQPGPDHDKPAVVKWDGAPVLVASTVAKLHDISPDGKRFLFTDDRTFGCFDRATSKMVWQIDTNLVQSAKFSPNGRTIVAGEIDDLKLYDAATGKTLYQLVPSGKEERIWQVMFRPDGTVLYELSYDPDPGPNGEFSGRYIHATVNWDPVARKEIRRFSVTNKIENGSHSVLQHRGTGFHMERSQGYFADTGNVLPGLVRYTRHTVNYTDPLTGKATPTIELNANDTVLDLSPDGKAILVRTVGEQPRLVDTTTGQTRTKLDGHKRLVTAGAFSPDGKLIATVTGTTLSDSDRAKLAGKIPEGPAELTVWDASSGKAIARSEFPTSEFDFVQVRFSPDSKFLVVASKGGREGQYRLWAAFGATPFGQKGAAALNFPLDVQRNNVIQSNARAVVADPLDKLIEELAKSTLDADQKVDAVFLAALGRFPTATERQRANEKYRQLNADTLRAGDGLRALLAEIAVTPEFEAHLKSLQIRAPAKFDPPLTPLPSPPNVQPPTKP
ncbi:sigma factor-like helix-turn-helix DNA-binding protein [Frigoriglobus tundricola]|uniref:sigma factor-like helix-turn-helix DNA-binding protein n=1 Tax=Frigoriglobus tundricola TaxID=2774151 RepID=UPI001D06D7A0|nr:sigma factor-like helix-turn-helix DNA-binding protein [Frigoriglobus tundricola]